MRSRLGLVGILLLLLFSLYAQAETPSRYQIYGGYSYLSNSLNGVPGAHHGLNGWDAAIAFAPWHHLRFKIDTFAYKGTNLGAPQNVFFVMAGGQYDHRIKRETVFAEALVGDGGANKDWGANRIAGETASFSTLVGGGLDTPISRRFAYRVSADFQYANFYLSGNLNLPYRIPGIPNYFGRLSTGVVWRF